MRTKSRLLVSVLLVVVGLWPTSILAQQERRSKKLIYYGWGSPDSQYVRQHWREMEEMPFDGVGIVVAIDRQAWQQGHRDTGNHLGWQIMGKKPFRVDDFQLATADLKAPKWRKFSDNFLAAVISPSQSGGLNWFDDRRWHIVANNFEVIAKIATEGRAKGLIIDPEHYDQSLFSYTEQRRQVNKPFALYAEMARRRGREIMKAISSVMPQPIILSLYAYSLPYAYTSGGRNLQDIEYGLLPAFYDGVLDAMPSGAKLIDGYEPAYYFKERRQFLEGYKQIQAARSLSAVPDLYTKKVTAGFGLWIDYKQNPHYFTAEEFERAVKSALDLSDEYVWIYSNGPRFFPPSRIAPSHIEALGNARRQIKP